MDELFKSQAPAFSAEQAQELAATHYGITATAFLLTSERDQNFRLDGKDGQSWLLKIANAGEADEVVAYENAIVRHLESVAPELPVPRLQKSLEKSDSVKVLHPDGAQHQIRLLSWLEGTMLREVAMDLPLRRELGASLAQIGLGLRGLFHPSAAKPLVWDITTLPKLKDKLAFVDDASLRRQCEDFIDDFKHRVQPALNKLRCQIIYNDLNPSNVLVSQQAPHQVSGIVDFGDAVFGPLICDVAVALSYLVTDTDDPLASPLDFLAAYHEVCPLEADELAVLLDLIIARAVTTILVTAWRAHLHPHNKDYILRNAASAKSALERLSELNRERVLDQLHAACPVAGGSASPSFAHADTTAMVQRRDHLLGSAYRLFYQQPVHMVRGRGVWLYDGQGRSYLDAYNNVPLVGHCHPQVVAALSHQAGKINTHTRYLHEGVLDYADALLGLMPAALNRVMFGCSGSEANELSLRIARAVTGNRGVIASTYAYHGNTIAIAQLSPSYANAEKPEDWVELIDPPDGYHPRRGPGDGPGHGQDDGQGAAEQRFLSGLEQAINNLAQRGIKPAALILDAGFTSDGMFPASPGLLKQAAELVRSAGGIYIADEVQAGFARLGKSLWGFGDGEVEPDIVTLGKPLGNGHPLAATVVQHYLLDEFARHTRYFNTFGGNPVSAAVGLAVLRVFQQENLAENSRDMGAYLHQRLGTLGQAHSLIGDVRGSGLFAGVELILDQDPSQPATEKCAELVNAMRDRGVLISMIGPHSNVLKIRPPLPFRRSHVDHLVDTLDQCLQD